MPAVIDPQQAARLSLRELIDRRAVEQADDIFVVAPDSGQTLTYGGLAEAARRIASLIAQGGVMPGDSVAYALSNGADAVTAILGIIYGGYRATAVNLIAGPRTIRHVLSHSQSRLVLAGPEHLPLVAGALGEAAAPPIVPVANGRWPAAGVAAAAIAPPPSPQSDGLLMYTSGTTGRPKGVVLTHANLLAGGANTALAHALTAADRALCVLPLYHINGLCVTVLGSLVAGGSLVVPAKFSVSRFWQLIAAHRCTWFSLVPTQISYLLHAAEKIGLTEVARQGLRFGRSASAPLAPDVQRAFEATFGVAIIETMGLTETAAPILSNPLPPGERRPGSPGIAFGNQVIIADDNQREVPRGAEGEVLVRGANVMNRYFRDSEATAEALTADGWLRTGDLGRMDEAGYVFITGRLKELIIKGGENIAPREIDEALYGHCDVVEAAAFARDCPTYGQRIEAAVSLAPSATATEDELISLCVARIGAFKAPDRVHFLSELPKGPSGKIQRLRLAQLTAGSGRHLR